LVGSTMMVPVICEWMKQKYLNVPGVVNVTE
jgi:hypothetical protein